MQKEKRGLPAVFVVAAVLGQRALAVVLYCIGLIGLEREETE